MTDQRQDDQISEQPVQDEDVSLPSDDETKIETWQDDLPPEDDFHDSDETAEEHVEEEPEEEGEETPPELGDKKRGKQVLIGIGAIGVVIIGGLMWLQFGSSSQGNGPSLTPIAEVMNVRDIKAKVGDRLPQAAPKVDDMAVSPKSGETDISSLYRAAQQQTGNGGAALPSAGLGEKVLQGADKSALGTSTDIMTLSDDQQQQASPRAMPAPPSAVPTPAPTPTPTPAPAAVPVAAVLPNKAVGPEQTPAPEAEAKMKALESQLGALQKALDTAVQHNDELTKKLESLQATPQPNGKQLEAENASLQDRLAKLEQQLAQAQASKNEAKQPARAPDAMAVADAGTEAIKADAREETSVHKKKAKTTRNKRSVSRRRSSSSAKWVLRAATPDAAWVSVGSHAAELRRVGIGETLPGIGRVQDIRQNGDAWEVVGTSGTLR